MSDTAQVLYFQAPGTVNCRKVILKPPQKGEVQVRALFSAISPGTEMLFFRGQVPEAMAMDSALPGMDRAAVYPLRYGYACVGEVCEIGDASLEDWLGRRVFAFHPHASRFNLSPDSLLPVPNHVDTPIAALFPNMETAISLAHDAAPLVGERVLIFGQGIVGLLTTWILASYRGLFIAVVDPLEPRRARSRAYGAHETYSPEDSDQLRAYNPDIIVELTGNPDALRTAVIIAGYHARIIVGSWYGSKPVELSLGQEFHRNRITIYSSQVSTLPAALGARWDKNRRYELAWKLLAELQSTAKRSDLHCTEGLITHRFPIQEAQAAYEQIAHAPHQTCQVLLTYPDSTQS